MKETTIGTKINETENNTVERIKSQGWYFERILKLINLWCDKQGKQKAQINTTDPIGFLEVWLKNIFFPNIRGLPSYIFIIMLCSEHIFYMISILSNLLRFVYGPVCAWP